MALFIVPIPIQGNSTTLSWYIIQVWSYSTAYLFWSLYSFNSFLNRCHCGQTNLAQDFTSDVSDLGCIDNQDDTRPLMSWESPSLYENTG